MCMRVCVSLCICARARECVRTCVRSCECVLARLNVRARACTFVYLRACARVWVCARA